MNNYTKYRWFYTKSGKLVVGGKSATQNDQLLKDILKTGDDYYVMHTSHPGSPFCIILAPQKNVTKKDLSECAIFTGCFSRAWKERKRKTTVDAFTTTQLYKDRSMKTGTWGVTGTRTSTKVELRLALTTQENTYRAVPEQTTTKKQTLLTVCPGATPKEKMLLQFAVALDDTGLDKQELLAALPAGGVRICT